MDAIAPDPALLDADRRWVRALWEALRPFATDGGGYVNFLAEPDQDRVRARVRAREVRAAGSPQDSLRPGQRLPPQREHHAGLMARVPRRRPPGMPTTRRADRCRGPAGRSRRRARSCRCRAPGDDRQAAAARPRQPDQPVVQVHAGGRRSIQRGQAGARWGRSTPISSRCAGVRAPSRVWICRSGAPSRETVSSYSEAVVHRRTGRRLLRLGQHLLDQSTGVVGVGRGQIRQPQRGRHVPPGDATRLRRARRRRRTRSEHLHRAPCLGHCLRRCRCRLPPPIAVAARMVACANAANREFGRSFVIVHRGVPDAALPFSHAKPPMAAAAR